MITAVVAGGVYYFRSKKPKTTYTTETATKGNLVRTVSITGTVMPPNEADLSFQLSGQIESLLVGVGDRVEAGQKIATIDKGTLGSQLAQAQYDVSVQKKTLINMERRSDTYNYFQKQAQRDVIKKYEEAVNAIVKNINDTALYSPISGTVVKKNAEVGETAVANSAILTVASDGDLKLEANVPESDIADVALGQKAKISPDAFPTGDTLEAAVNEIEPASNVVQDVVYYKIKLVFPSQDERLKIGMSADVDINTGEKDGVVMIPFRAIKNDGDQKYVEILQPDNTTKRASIQTGFMGDDGMVEITSGLSGGENVVTLTKTP